MHTNSYQKVVVTACTSMMDMGDMAAQKPTLQVISHYLSPETCMLEGVPWLTRASCCKARQQRERV